MQELATLGPLAAQVPLVCQSSDWPDVQLDFPISGKLDLMVSAANIHVMDLKTSGMPFSELTDRKYQQSLQWRIYSHAMRADAFTYLHLWIDYHSAPGASEKQFVFNVRDSRLSVSTTFQYNDYEHEQTASMIYDAVDVLLELGLIKP